MKPKIACYITGGWTECGYMTRFLERINDRCDYRQRFPQKAIGKKNKDRVAEHIEGTTGEALIRKVYSDLERHRDELIKYAAVLIEDDLDERFFQESFCGRDYVKIEERKLQITEEIRKRLGKTDLPVFFLYALPEIEAWFLADWEHTFHQEYKVLLKGANDYFSSTFRMFISKYVLTDTYAGSEIENYGMFDGKYKKLSDEVIQAFQGYSCRGESEKNNEKLDEKINKLVGTNQIYYSKKEQGRNMLSRLEPEKVAAVCTHYFSKTFTELENF